MTEASVAVQAGYQVGSWVGLAGSRVWLLADMDHTDPAVGSCWSLVSRGAEMTHVLGAMLAAARPVTDFAIVRITDGAVHVMARGSVVVALVTAGGEQTEVRAATDGDWADRRVDGPVSEAWLGAMDARDQAGGLLPLGAGVVFSSAIVLRFGVGDAAPPTTTAHLAPAEPPVPLPRPERVADEPDPASRSLTEDGRTLTGEPDPSDTDSQFAHMMRHSVPSEARPQATVDDSDPWPSIPLHSAGVDPGSASGPARGVDGSARSRESGRELIDDVSWALSPQDANSPPAWQRAESREVGRAGRGAGIDQHDGYADDEDLDMTVHTGRAPGVQREGAGPGTGTRVHAVRCAKGHLNPADAAKCRVCATAIAPQPPVLEVRPVLGRLRLSNGEVIQLDRGVIMGRRPGEPEPGERERPHRVRLQSPDNDISRRHVRVLLDGWDVVLVDLESRNGTTVTTADGVTETLAPGARTVLQAGATVSLSDTVYFQYEVTA